jgi:signal transduction histidine kinase
MKIFTEKNFSKLIFLNATIGALMMLLGVIGYTYWDSEANLKKELLQMEEQYIKNKKISVRESVLDFIRSIDMRQKTTNTMLRSTLKDQVEQIHSIAMHLYQKNAVTMDKDTLEELIIEVIRPITFNNERNYFFIRSMSGMTKLWPSDPEQEGKSVYNNSELQVLNSVFTTVRQQGSGFNEYLWPKPGEDNDKLYQKIAYIKHFEPFDWYIGSSDYLVEVERDAQQHVTNIINQHASRTDDEYMFILDLRSMKGGEKFATMLVSPNHPDPLDNLLSDEYQDMQGETFRENFLNGLKKHGEVFVKYKNQKPETDKVRPKMSYFKLYPKWSWIIARGFYFDDLIDQINLIKGDHQKKIREKIYISLVILCVIFLGSLSISLLFAYKVTNVSFTSQEVINTQELALPLIYLRHLKGANWKFQIILFLCTGIFFGLSWKFPQINLSTLPFVLLALLSLLIVKEVLIEYRIKKGIFGTNRTEARALIEFIIKNSDDIDFTDSNGSLRRALLPAAEPASTEQPLPAFGEEATA